MSHIYETNFSTLTVQFYFYLFMSPDVWYKTLAYGYVVPQNMQLAEIEYYKTWIRIRILVV